MCKDTEVWLTRAATCMSSWYYRSVCAHAFALGGFEENMGVDCRSYAKQ